MSKRLASRFDRVGAGRGRFEHGRFGQARPRVGGSVPSEWSPTNLGASLLGWWAADRLDLISRSGAQVTSWRDVVGGYNLSQAISGSRPLYSASIFNGSPGVDFDGTDDYLSLESVPFPTGASPSEIWALVQQDIPGPTAGLTRGFIYGSDSTGSSRLFSRTTVSNVSRAAIVSGNGAATGGTDTIVSFDGRHVVRAEFGATAFKLTIDGEAGGAAGSSVPVTGTYRTRMGASTAEVPTNFWDGAFRDLIVTSPLNEEQSALLQTYLMNKRRP